MTYTKNTINEAYWRKFTERSSAFYKEKMLQLGSEASLQGTLFGQTTPNHLMYKLETLYSADQHRAYEFLIEYDVWEPDVSIYYGCKGLTLDGYNHDEEIAKFNEEWQQIQGHVCTVLNNTFPGKHFSMRLKATNNANDNTYWPFWITLHEEEDIKGVGLRALKIIRSAYKAFHSGETLPYCELPSFKD